MHEITSSQIEIVYQGKKYTGHYKIEDGMIHVSTNYNEKSAVLRKSPAEALAKIMLRELVQEGIAASYVE